MLTPLALTMSCSFDVERVPLKLACSIVGMTMKCPDHQVKLCILCFCAQTTGLKGLCKRASNVISTTNTIANQIN
jgi:hypothetical protein